MPSTIDASTELRSPSVVEHGLLILVTLMFGGAAMSLEVVEVLTGIIGALAVCVMKESASRHRKCVDEPVKPVRNNQPTLSGSEVAPLMQEAGAKAQPSFADEMPQCGQENTRLNVCAHAELSTMRAEFDLASWRLKVETDEAELTRLQANIAKLEEDLLQTADEQIDALLMIISEAKLRAETLETQLVQSTTKVAHLDKEVARALSTQIKAEESAQSSIDAYLTDLMEANFQWTGDYLDMSWPDEPCEPLNECDGDERLA